VRACNPRFEVVKISVIKYFPSLEAVYIEIFCVRVRHFTIYMPPTYDANSVD